MLTVRVKGRKIPRRKRMTPIKPSHRNELWYKAELLRVVKAIRRKVEPELIRVIKQAQVGDGFVGDADMRESTIKALLTRLSNSFGGMDSIARRLAGLAVQRNLQEVDSGLIASIRQAIGVNIASALSRSGAVAGAVQNATTNNIALIKSIPTKYFEKLNKAVTDNFNQGFRYEALIERVREVGDVTESRAKLIARDQTSKMNSSFNETRQKDLGIQEYIWQTSGDERVRDDHREKDGKRFKWSDPPADTGHPGEDIQCRCVAIPVFDLNKMEAELGLAAPRSTELSSSQPTQSQLFPNVDS